MLAAILAFGLFGGHSARPCPNALFVECQDTRALAANAGFQLALHDFLGGAHERYLHGDKPLYGQVMDLIANPMQPGQAVGEDMRLFAGCRRFACPGGTAPENARLVQALIDAARSARAESRPGGR